MSSPIRHVRHIQHIRRAIAVAALVPLFFAGCKADHSDLASFTVSELAAMLVQGVALTVLDANNDDTRAKRGIIPGAVLLSSYRDYLWSELPTDKASQLIFYCASEMCSAAPTAARKAVAAGYSAVAVLPAGIKGWLEEGQPVDELPTS
ncbi:MAG: rhodanese-like domain-containing protein [Proteobacteria bacterium]|nr:rhodanese-like domain-containing protein [Pseudomonadota bacterium]